MSTHAAGTFEIESWEEEPYDEREGAKLTRTRLTKTFRGDAARRARPKRRPAALRRFLASLVTTASSQGLKGAPDRKLPRAR